MSDHAPAPGQGTEAPATGPMGVAAAGAGAAALATAAGACCVPIVAPLIVAVLGASGAAWAAGLKPYGLPILLFASLFLAWGHWSLYRTRPLPEGQVCPATRPRTPRIVMWAATALWAAAVLLNVASVTGAFQP